MTQQEEIKEHLKYYEKILQNEKQFFDEPVERQIMFFLLGKQFLENLMDTLEEHPTDRNYLKSLYYKAFLETAEHARIIYEKC